MRQDSAVGSKNNSDNDNDNTYFREVCLLTEFARLQLFF